MRRRNEWARGAARHTTTLLNLRRVSLFAVATWIAACNALLGNENGSSQDVPLGSVDGSSTSSTSSGVVFVEDGASPQDAAADAAEDHCANSVCVGCTALGMTAVLQVAAADDALYVRTARQIDRYPLDPDSGLPNGTLELMLTATGESSIAVAHEVPPSPSTLFAIQAGDRMIACRGGSCSTEAALGGPSAVASGFGSVFVLSKVQNGSVEQWLVRELNAPAAQSEAPTIQPVQQSAFGLQDGPRYLLAASRSAAVIATEGTMPFVTLGATQQPPWLSRLGALPSTGLRAVAMSEHFAYFAGGCPNSAAVCRAKPDALDTLSPVLDPNAPAVGALFASATGNGEQVALEDQLLGSDSTGTWSCRTDACSARTMLLDRCSASQFTGNARHVFFTAAGRVYAVPRAL